MHQQIGCVAVPEIVDLILGSPAYFVTRRKSRVAMSCRYSGLAVRLAEGQVQVDDV